MNEIKKDYILLAQLARELEKWDNQKEIILNRDWRIYGGFIITSYKNISWPDLAIPLDLYQLRLKQKERDNTLNSLLHPCI